jgi:hypothetical protein
LKDHKFRNIACPHGDELTIAGGLTGRPTEVVKSETNDIFVPAWAEMIIEGEIALDDFIVEGPYSECYGYQGPRKKDVFRMRIAADVSFGSTPAGGPQGGRPTAPHPIPAAQTRVFYPPD